MNHTPVNVNKNRHSTWPACVHKYYITTVHVHSIMGSATQIHVCVHSLAPQSEAGGTQVTQTSAVSIGTRTTC